MGSASGMNFLKQLLERLPSYVFWKDRDGVYLGCNSAFAKSVGLSASEEIVGKTDYDLPATKAESDAYRADDRAVMELNKPRINFEEKQTTKEGREVTLLTSKVPLTDEEGTVVGVLGIYNDITELKKVQSDLLNAKEKAEAANEAKTQFIQNMQHDIRTPAVGMFGILSQLEETKTDPEEKALFGMLAKASENLLNLCNDVVAFGDLENSEPIAEAMIDIRKIARNVLSLNKPAAFGKNLVLKLTVDREVPANVFLDEFRLQRVLINLIGNAIKFTEKGHVALHLVSRIDDQRHGVVRIDVSDTGIGIPSDKKQVIFERFTRLTPSNTNRYPGTGLGLYVVKKFVEDLQGDFSVDSTPGKGSRFTVMLPFKIPLLETAKQPETIEEEYHSPLVHLKASSKTNTLAEEKPTKVQQSITDNPTAPFHHTLLLIEDNEICLLMQKNMLDPLVKHMDTAASVAEASDKLAKNDYDIVISDLGLPDGNGMDIVSFIKANPHLRNYATPFIALTAHQDLETHEKAFAAGFLEVDTKPLEKERAYTFLEKYPMMNTTAPEVASDDLPIIDLALAMKRMNTKDSDNALHLLKVFVNTFDENIDMLKENQQREDGINALRDILHRECGGFAYLGLPRLERAWIALNEAIKTTDDVKKLTHLFDAVYQEADLFQEEYKRGNYNAPAMKINKSALEIATTEVAPSIAPLSMASKPTSAFSHKVLFIEDDDICFLMGKKILLDFTAVENLNTATTVAEAKRKLAENDYDLVISDLGLPDGNGMDIVSSIKANPGCRNHRTPFIALTAHQDPKMHQKAIAAGFLEITTKPLTKERAHTFFKKYPVIDVTTPEVAMDDLPIIDLALGMKRISATEPTNALNILKTFADTLDQDIIPLKAAQEREDIKAIRNLLHKMCGGFHYTGVPRIERACIALHHAVKATDNVKNIADRFDRVYKEVLVFKEKYDKEFRK